MTESPVLFRSVNAEAKTTDSGRRFLTDSREDDFIMQDYMKEAAGVSCLLLCTTGTD